MVKLPERAARPLLSISDPQIKEKAISHVENVLNRKTPTGGDYTQKLTVGDVVKRQCSGEKGEENRTQCPNGHRVVKRKNPKRRKKRKRAIGSRKRLNLQFPQAKNDFSFLPTDTVLELGKKSNASFLEECLACVRIIHRRCSGEKESYSSLLNPVPNLSS